MFRQVTRLSKEIFKLYSKFQTKTEAKFALMNRAPESMEVGQVGFHKQKEVRKIRVAKRENVVVNRLNKTKEERTSVDFREEREKRDRSEREEKKRIFKVMINRNNKSLLKRSTEAKPRRSQAE